MDIKDKIGFADGVPRFALEAAMNTTGSMAFPGLAVMQLSSEFAGYVPAFVAMGLAEAEYIAFETWWTEPRMFDPAANTVNRKQIVMWLANKDGGAHIDKLPPTYEALSRNGSMGLTFHSQGTTSNATSPIPAAMRQIAEEVRTSLRKAADEG